jgi:uncharacterized protein
MLRTFTPQFFVPSVLDIRPVQLLSLGLRNLLLDVDGTLKSFNELSFSPQTVNWIEELKAAKITLCILSNGLGRRIEQLANRLDIPFVPKALKPLPFGCYRAMKKINATSEETAIIGDQLFADVLAGRLAGIKTILVTPTSLEEPWFTALKRPLERRLLHWLRPNPGLPEVPGLIRTLNSQKASEPVSDSV